ncbi:hypothetical protein KP509_03G070300 [Ceratopteris richardii]|uniref:Uncharacterized protein n=1 Tax=Ceratopteris richardii TaxID=49495 RepID=A0A8T2V4Z8_CERRI|nr:hypothetical protein KP509_03G070300 [Ceratopteris richardii]
MASALKQALKWAKNLPWNVTGPTSHPEYRDSLTNVKDYRAFSPATPSKKAIVPRSDPDHVFNITYFSRFPGRRKMFPASSSDKDPKDMSVKEKRLPSPSIYRLGYSVPLDDCPGDGYQK